MKNTAQMTYSQYLKGCDANILEEKIEKARRLCHALGARVIDDDQRLAISKLQCLMESLEPHAHVLICRKLDVSQAHLPMSVDELYETLAYILLEGARIRNTLIAGLCGK